ncbi:alpha/beta hydrolase [Catalinimonas sp. 4WD22]|uniref:alpha/beta fold hydrolase n=1 Tax=Catalinimonas locisalis TaxID=3133978 RepID=UPI003100BFAA
MIRKISYKSYQVHVHLEGEGGEVVLMLHGWPSNSHLWKAQRDFLKDKYKVITPDWLGFGNSDKPKAHQYSLASMVEILDNLVEQMLPHEEKLTIIAHDIGGPAALLWASDHQDRVNSLIMLNTLFYNFQTPLDKLGHFVFNLPLINRIQLSDFGLSSLVLNLLKNKQKDSLQSACEMLKGHEAWPHAIRRKTIIEPLDKEGRKQVSKLASTFKTLTIDKYLIIGRKDPLCFAHMQRIHEENTEVPAYFLENCGHYIPLDQSKMLNKLLEQILAPSSQEKQKMDYGNA